MDIRKLSQNEIPEILFQIPHPPKELYISGVLPPKDHIYVCVVGSRKHTKYGQEVCEKLIEGLKGYPIVIVSGLALGIDAIAHKAAIKAGLKTIAFPGSGLDEKVLYPRTNFLLAKEIVKNGGCLISEFEPDFKAELWSFAQRNRLMAGISQATLVIEAEEKSGTLITSKLATDYNRDVLAVPGSIFSPNSKGTHMLLALGATPITSSEDIISLLNLDQKQKSLL